MTLRALGLIVGFWAAAAAAADINYDYVEAGYQLTNIDVQAPFDGNGDGPLLGASMMLRGPVFVFGQVGYTDFADDGVKFEQIQFGFGARRALGPFASAFVRVAYVRTDVELAAARDFDEDGYGVTLGYRAVNRSPWEFTGTIDYVNVESGVEAGGGVTLKYDLTRQLAVIGGARYFEESTSGFLGVRYWLRPTF